MQMSRSHLSLVGRSLFWSVLAGFLAPFVIGLFVHVNLRVDAKIPWFVVPAIVVAFATFQWSERFAQPSPKPRVRSAGVALVISILLSAALGGIGLMIMGYDSWREGRALLSGDRYPAPALFRNVNSLMSLASAGVIEEGTVRNVVQLWLQRELNPLVAEAIAGGMFVLTHAGRFGTPGELPFVTLVALGCGRLTAYTQKAWYAALVHSLSNLVIGVTVLSHRH